MLDAPAEEPLKYTSKITPGDLSEWHLCAAAFGYVWLASDSEFKQLFCVCSGATDLVNICIDTSQSAVLSVSSLLASFPLFCVSTGSSWYTSGTDSRWNQLHLNFNM